MPESNDPFPSLENLQHRIDKAQSTSDEHTGKEQGEMSDASRSALAEATQLAWGLVSGASVGCIGGYFIDRWLGTSPLFLIGCFFLGFAAGLYSLMRKVGKKD